MPKETQNSDDPNATRIRNNQRRSRARRREYTQELEARIREYEVKGVRVAQEIQDAAKAVIEENRQLKRALDDLTPGHGSMGYSTASGQVADKAKVLERALGRAGKWTEPGLGGREIKGTKQRKLDEAVENAQMISPASTSASGATPATSPIAPDPACGLRSAPAQPCRYDCDQSTRVHVQRGDHHPSSIAIERHRPQALNLRPPPKEPSYESDNKGVGAPALQQELNSADDTSSCAFAVAILTNLRADLSAEQVQADLGCASDLEKCKVDNKRLFGTVDRYTG